MTEFLRTLWVLNFRFSELCPWKYFVNQSIFSITQCGNYGNSLSPKKYFVKSFLSNLHIYLLLSRNFWERIPVISTLCISNTHCGNYGNLLSHFIGENFVKATVLLKKSLKSWFDEKNYGESKFFLFPHCVCVVRMIWVWQFWRNFC